LVDVFFGGVEGCCMCIFDGDFEWVTVRVLHDATVRFHMMPAGGCFCDTWLYGVRSIDAK